MPFATGHLAFNPDDPEESAAFRDSLVLLSLQHGSSSPVGALTTPHTHLPRGATYSKIHEAQELLQDLCHYGEVSFR